MKPLSPAQRDVLRQLAAAPEAVAIGGARLHTTFVLARRGLVTRTGRLVAITEAGRAALRADDEDRASAARQLERARAAMAAARARAGPA